MRPSVVHCAWHARAVLGQQLSGEGQQSVPAWETTRVWPVSQTTSANWPRLAEAGGRPELELALAGRAEGELADASGRLVSTWAAYP